MSVLEREPGAFQQLRAWAKSHSAYIHPSLTFVSDATGTSVRATRDIPPDTTVLSCPFDIAITRDLAIGALKAAIWDVSVPRGRVSGRTDLSLAARVEQLSERQIICAYLIMHWILLVDRRSTEPPLASTSQFKHLPYLASLPHNEQLRTPLHFTPAELELLKGTNLHGATEDRRAEWQEEWEQVKDIIAQADASWAEDFTWDRYLTAATYISSRAFPSTILSSTPSLYPAPGDSSYPILLPILDCLNHSRGQPVTWAVSSSNPDPDASPSIRAADMNASPLHITLLIHAATPANSDVFNNYGAKPNAELLLGYGFVIPSNPEDTIVLKLGGSDRRHEIGRDVSSAVREGKPTGQAITDLWEEVETMVLTSGGDDDMSVTSVEGGWEVTLEVCQALEDMVVRKIDALPEVPTTPILGTGTSGREVRAEVASMVAEYIQGQRDILNGILDYVDMRKRSAIDSAREEGVAVEEEGVEE